jgi:hypothetical protein
MNFINSLSQKVDTINIVEFFFYKYTRAKLKYHAYNIFIDVALHTYLLELSMCCFFFYIQDMLNHSEKHIDLHRKLGNFILSEMLTLTLLLQSYPIVV